ncbi:MAG: helix-turn-helix domain-containing protein [Actinobacteria bacterium]|nr:helix-turn-helix domain-containing protein [Actinomycetota bacterium]
MSIATSRAGGREVVGEVPLLTTREIATELAVSEDWVREHAAELGGIRMGKSSRGPLRFEREHVDQYLDRQRLDAPQEPQSRLQRRRPGPRPAAAGVELLPLPEGVQKRTPR